jgi:hypothetical protein
LQGFPKRSLRPGVRNRAVQRRCPERQASHDGLGATPNDLSGDFDLDWHAETVRELNAHVSSNGWSLDELIEETTPMSCTLKIEWFRDRSPNLRSHVGTCIDSPTTVSITFEKWSSVWFALRTSIHEEILN